MADDAANTLRILALEARQLDGPVAELLARALPSIASIVEERGNRLRVLERAVAGAVTRPDPEIDTVTTVFGIPVTLAPGVDADRVRSAVDELRPGLAASAAVEVLECDGLLARVGE